MKENSFSSIELQEVFLNVKKGNCTILLAAAQAKVKS